MRPAGRSNVTERDHVSRQHLLSVVVQKRWAENRVVAWVDVRKPDRRTRPEGPKAHGWRLDFISEGSRPYEDLWGKIENEAPKALDAVEAGIALDDPAVIRTLKDLLALHLVRGHAMATLWAQGAASDDAEQHWEDFIDGLSSRPGAIDDLFEQLTGFASPQTPGARLEALDRARSLWDGRLAAGGKAFADSVVRMLERTRGYVSRQSLEIGYAEHGVEFVLGDAPAQTLDTKARKVGVLAGVSLDRADLIFMPVTPKAVVAVASSDRVSEVRADAVKQLNLAMIAAARERIVMRPSSGLKDWVREVCLDKLNA